MRALRYPRRLAGSSGSGGIDFILYGRPENERLPRRMIIDAICRTTDVAEVLRRELELLVDADRSGQEYAWLWETRAPAVVLGRAGRVEAEVLGAACAEDGVPVLRRHSGGGAVVLGPGCVNYTLIFNLDERPELYDVAGSYGRILPRVLRAVGVAGCEVAGGDLARGGRKFGGCSQRRSRRSVLHHGTLLSEFDLELVGRYLAEPVRQPEYRRGRRHGEFLTNVGLDGGFGERFLAEFAGARGME